MKLDVQKAVSPGSRSMEVAKVREYLIETGFLDDDDFAGDFGGKIPRETDERRLKRITFDENLEAAVRLFQHTYQLPEDGRVADETLELMQRPRCGVPDGPRGAIARLAQPVCAWRKRALRYHFIDFLPQIGETKHRKIFVDNLHIWGSIVRLTFSEGARGSEIQSFNYSGDGPGKVYGYGYYPCANRVAGDIHFDVNDVWSAASTTPRNKVDFLSVCIHEQGHALGLGHSNVRTAVMWPYTAFGEMRRQPTPDDVDGIKHLYP